MAKSSRTLEAYEIYWTAESARQDLRRLWEAKSLHVDEQARPSAQKTFVKQDMALLAMLDSMLLMTGQPRHATVAMQSVFQIPELLERILSSLTIKALVEVSRVCKAFLNTIDESPLLQQKLQTRFRPLQTNSWFSAFMNGCLDFPGFEVRVVTGKTAGSALQAQFTSQRIMSIGVKCRQMLICQPPVVEMNVSYRGQPWPVTLTNALDTMQSQPMPVKSATGITVGHLYDTAKTLVEQARKLGSNDLRCPTEGRRSPHYHSWPPHIGHIYFQAADYLDMSTEQAREW